MGRPSDPPELRLLKNDKAHAHKFKEREDEVEVCINSVDSCEDFEKFEFMSEMSERASQIFKETYMRLNEGYQLTIFDVKLILLYSNNQEQLEATELFLRSNGLTYCEETANSFRIKERPQVSIHEKCKNVAIKLLNDFKKLPKKKKEAKANGFSKFAVNEK